MCAFRHHQVASDQILKMGEHRKRGRLFEIGV